MSENEIRKNAVELNEEEMDLVSGGRTIRTQYYVAQKGDTLPRIANRFNTTVQKLMDMNPNIDPDKIYAGVKIRVK